MDTAALQDWVRSCLSKRYYSVEGIAQKAATRAGRRFKLRQLRPYWCHHCGGYHLTTRPAS